MKKTNKGSKKNRLAEKIAQLNPVKISNKNQNFLGPLNPFSSAQEEKLEQTIETNTELSCETERCPHGYRCDNDTESSNYKKCIEKFKIKLNGTFLEVVKRKNKAYNDTLTAFLNAHLDEIKSLKQEKISNLKKKVIKNRKDLKDKNSNYNASYGDLKHEIIIEYLYLEQELNRLNNIVQEEEKEEEIEEEIAYTPEELDNNENIGIEIEEEMKDESVQPESAIDSNMIESIESKEQFPELEVELSEKEKELQESIAIEPEDKESAEYNKFLFNKEKIENEYHKQNTEPTDLYPLHDDPNFNLKLSQHKEFQETMYKGEIKDIKQQAEFFCNKDFELLPHQLFVKNFMSFETPYNSLLLFHGLGTGKTCSAIGIAEEMRSYMKQINLNQRILIIASPNVQNNFKLQLFDDRKLKFENGLWNLQTCIGDSLLSEINPAQYIKLSKEKLISQINNLINQYYIFMGYRELGNFIKRKINVSSDGATSVQQQKQMEMQKIKQYFSNRLIIIDEVHNLRILQENKEAKKTANLLMNVCKKADNLRLLMLSATPMYNSYKEIIWITNLLNTVDKRSEIKEEDVFDNDGNFVEERTDKNGNTLESGEELLQRKLTGYVSYVRGENPYSFPFRVYPNEFDEEKTMNKDEYFKTQLNGKTIENPIESAPIYINGIGSYQGKVYNEIIKTMKNKNLSLELNEPLKTMPTFENMESFGYIELKQPLESLNIVFPNEEFDTSLESGNVNNKILGDMVGKAGLSKVMNYEHGIQGGEEWFNYDYKPEIKNKYGNIFNLDNLEKYSKKIHEICSIIKNSTGQIIVYSFYIDGGVVPLALSLEEMGFTRYGSSNNTKTLFKDVQAEPIDSLTMKTKEELKQEDPNAKFKQAKYVMITGDKKYSPNNLEDIKEITKPENKYGEDVKVILITRAAAEGIDFKYIRQVHILDPWYNLNRLEQIIGRGVRNLSHCGLPFEERNVEIYMHGSKLEESEEEPADMYVYRFAEKKSKLIGNVTRLMKETSVDCLLNIEQSNFTIDKLASLAENQNIKIKLANQTEIDFKIGDKPFSSVCDYMESCEYTCKPSGEINSEEAKKNMYSDNFAKINYLSIVKRIRQLFKEQSFYKKDDLIKEINILNNYPQEHIYFALSIFVENKKDYLLDKHGRKGYLINADEYYAFQPNEINDETISVYERSVPLDYKRENLLFEIPKKKMNEEQSSLTSSIQQIQENTSYQLEDNSNEPEKIISKNFKLIEKELEYNINLVEIHKRKYQKIQQHLERKEYLIQNEINLDTGEKEELKKIKKELISHENSYNEEKNKNGYESLGLKTGENNWYIHFGRVYYILKINHFIQDELLKEYCIYHFLETQTHERKLFLVNYLYSSMYQDKSNTNIEIIKQYFDNKIIKNGIKYGMVIAIDDGISLYIKNENSWEEAQPSELNEFQRELVNLKHNSQHINNFIGFYHNAKNSYKEPIFKLKDREKNIKNNIGAQCSTLGKIEIIKKLNLLLTSNPYLELRDKKTEYTNTDVSDIFKPGLCVLTEIIMRHFDNKKTERKWFFNQEEAILNNTKSMKN